MYSQIITISLLALAGVSYASVNGWIDCGSPMGLIHEIRVRNCFQVPCAFQRGVPMYIEADVTARVYSEDFPFATTIQFVGQTFTILAGNACDFLVQGHCPIAYGDTFTFREEILIGPLIPAINIMARTTGRHTNGSIVFCFDLPAQVV